jgi:hypothetical protein
MKTKPRLHALWSIGILAMYLLGVLTWAPRPALAAWTVGEPIVTYYAGPGREYPQNNASATQLAEGGWNLVWAKSVAELNVAYSHGLRAMWTGSLSNSTVNAIRNHPALYSYYLADEPSAARFPELAATVTRLRGLDPDRMAYINLFPTYATNEQLGTDGYQQYLSDYMSIVQPDLLSYDHYHFMVGKDTRDYFKNLALVSHTAKQAGIPFINIIQACSWESGVRVPTSDELRFLYSTSLAYGAEGISDFVYRYDSFTGGMARSDGTTTALYSAAKTYNAEFEAIAQQVQSLHHIGAYHLGDEPPGFGGEDGSSPMRLPGNSPFTISNIPETNYQKDAPVRGAVLGLFGSDDSLVDATCTVVANLNYLSELVAHVIGPDNLSVFDPATGTWIPQGHAWADVTLPKGGAVLVGLTSVVPEPASWVLLITGLFSLLAYSCKRRLRSV